MPTRRQLANAIRALSMDAVQKANSGHPGMPMGMADIAQVLWSDYLRHNPGNPELARPRPFRAVERPRVDAAVFAAAPDRLSARASTRSQSFRQFGSHTAGHPEVDRAPRHRDHHRPARPGPRQCRRHGARGEDCSPPTFNRPGHEIVDHHTWVFLGDGCLMEGVSHEACSLAGTLKLGKLVCFYDDNGISIDGEVHGWFTDDTPKRFEAYGWQVVRDVDGHDADAVERAIEAAKADTRGRR